MIKDAEMREVLLEIRDILNVILEEQAQIMKLINELRNEQKKIQEEIKQKNLLSQSVISSKTDIIN